MTTYPVSNRPQDLQIDFFYLQRQVGKYLNYGYASAIWDDEMEQAVDEIIQEGLRSYYFPPVLPPQYALGAVHVHEWSFMRPIFQLNTVASQRRYPLPDNWERPIGDICYTDNTNDLYAPIKFTSASRLHTLEFQDNFTSHPQYAAVEPSDSVGDSPQGQTLVLHPTPSGSYELTCQYQAHARRLTKEHPYPLGGQIHGPGILASCLAVAELRKNGAEGPMQANFLSKLAANVVRDSERGAALLGYNSGQDRYHNCGRGSIRACGGLYYNDVSYNSTYYNGE